MLGVALLAARPRTCGSAPGSRGWARVEVVARAVQVGRHQEDAVEAVLLAVGLRASRAAPSWRSRRGRWSPRGSRPTGRPRERARACTSGRSRRCRPGRTSATPRGAPARSVQAHRQVRVEEAAGAARGWRRSRRPRRRGARRRSGARCSNSSATARASVRSNSALRGTDHARRRARAAARRRARRGSRRRQSLACAFRRGPSGQDMRRS